MALSVRESEKLTYAMLDGPIAANHVRGEALDTAQIHDARAENFWGVWIGEDHERELSGKHVPEGASSLQQTSKTASVAVIGHLFALLAKTR